MPPSTHPNRDQEAPPSPDPLLTASRHRALFFISLFLLSALSLYPLWATRLLPMQDYPQHLFLAHLTANFHDPAFNWGEFYSVNLGFRPYMLWYLVVNLLALVFQIETVGKILFSLYILLIALLALAARRLAAPGSLPWGALLLFPFAFNQMYFMGFANYILSLPLLFLALLDLERLASGLTGWRLARQGLYCLLLFLNHPYSVLVYLALAAVSALFARDTRAQSLRMLIAPGILSLIFVLWYLLQHGPSSAPTAAPWRLTWWPLAGSLTYYLLQFTGMRWTGGPQWLTVALWCLAALPFLARWREHREDATWGRLVALYLATVAGFALLPFWMGYYAYFNLRLAPVSYFALALLLCRIPLPSRSGLFLAAVVLALLLGSVRTQKAVAREAEAVIPVLKAARQNALILPLIFDGASDALDSVYFYQMHSHEPDYYHLLVGGGASPTLFPNAMMPVQYRPGLQLPYPETVFDFSWQAHGAYYDYLLIRKAPDKLCRKLSATCDLVARAGPWSLFGNRTARQPL